MFRHDTKEETFRTEVREWLRANLPDELRGRTVRPEPSELMPWYKTLARKKWIAPHWPKEHGGMGATFSEQIIMMEEFARADAPELPGQGLNHIGPILIEFGTAAHKAKHLPPIVSGKVIWAQGYSEPGAGSDLASLSTSATLQDQYFVVRGQKTWTTWGHNADWMFALVRTDPSASPRHAGISFLLIDLHSPGIKIRPIKTIVGDEEFSEVFFDDAVVPAENLVGQLNDGWRIATTLLSYERIAGANIHSAVITLERVKILARASGAFEDPIFQDRIAEVSIEFLALLALFRREAELMHHDKKPGPASSVINIVGSELLQRLNDLLLETAGGFATYEGRINIGDESVEVAKSYLQARRATIYGGTSEIQRNIIAKRVLNLPKE